MLAAMGFQKEEVMAVTLLLVTAGWEEQGGWRQGRGSRRSSGLGSEAFPETLVKAFSVSPQTNVMAGKVPEVAPLGTAEKKVKMLEQQRMEVVG